MQLAERLRAGISVRLTAQRLVWLAERFRIVLGELLGLSANWLNDPTLGDALVLSGAAMVAVRR
jgi:hypothetical protein